MTRRLVDIVRDPDLCRRLVHSAHSALAMNPFERSNHYGAILADPPWVFETWSAKGRGRSAERHYRTMPDEDLWAMPVRQIAKRDALLFLWSSGPVLVRSLNLMKEWGFTYSTVVFVWDKDATGLGYWTRSNCEFVLLGKRGSPGRKAKDVLQLVKAHRGQHSEKPVEVARRIERLCDGPYLEVFARAQRKGWDVWGDEVETEPRAMGSGTTGSDTSTKPLEER